MSFHLSRRPDFAAAWMNLGIVQNSLRKFGDAEQSYWNAIKFRRKYPDCYYNLGRLVSSQSGSTVSDPGTPSQGERRSVDPHHACSEIIFLCFKDQMFSVYKKRYK